MAQIFLNKEKTRYTTDALKGKMECEILINEEVDDGRAILYKITDLRTKSKSYTVKHKAKKSENKRKFSTETDAKKHIESLKTEDILLSIEDCQEGTIYLNRICGEFIVSVVDHGDDIIFKRVYKTLNGAKNMVQRLSVVDENVCF